ncbi:hypothetical protein KY327_02070 [Candidatus Woesearchaeota archaeon]|nr:hypothetical protein [Candidatus Woesearchaeota archaeon]
MSRYGWLLAFKAVAGAASVVTLLQGWPVVTLGVLAAFIFVHTYALRHARSKGVPHYLAIISSAISTATVLTLLGVLLAWQRIPIMLGAVFVAASFIKILFVLLSLPTKGVRPHKPEKSNWALLASVIFLACYIVPQYEKLALVSALFLIYLLLAVASFVKGIMARKALSRRRRLAARR